MITQLSLSLARVDANADPLWAAACDDAIQAVCAEKKEFTADTIWEELQRRGWGYVREPRAIGPRLLAAMRAGLCERTDRFVPCGRESRHFAPIRQWRSKVT